MNKIIYNILDKVVVIAAILLGIGFLALWILPFFSPLPWQTEIEESYDDSPTSQENLDFYYDVWPPQ